MLVSSPGINIALDLTVTRVARLQNGFPPAENAFHPANSLLPGAILFLARCFGRNDWGQLGSGNSADNRGDGPDEMGDNLPVVQLAAAGADVTVSALDAYNGPCAIMQSSASVGVALKCWGPNGYGSLGLVS